MQMTKHISSVNQTRITFLLAITTVLDQDVAN